MAIFPTWASWVSLTLLSISTIAALICTLFVKNYLPAYANEKGKNLATSEDIKEITQKVEDVKATFSKDIEGVKATLAVSSNVQISMYQFERNAIVSLHGIFYRWFSIATDLRTLNELEPSNSGQFEKDIRAAYEEVKIKQPDFDLFIDDANLRKLGDDFINTMLTDLHNQTIAHCANIIANPLSSHQHLLKINHYKSMIAGKVKATMLLSDFQIAARNFISYRAK